MCARENAKRRSGATWEVIRLGERRKFFVSGDTLFARGSHEVFERERKRRARRVGLKR